MLLRDFKRLKKRLVFGAMFLACFVYVGISGLTAQESINLDIKTYELSDAIDLFENGHYASAKKHLYELTNQYSSNTSEGSELIRKARLYSALCDLKSYEDSGDQAVINYIQENKTSPYLNVAYMELGDHYYNTRQYESAIEYFSAVDLDGIDNDRYSEIVFKRAYSHFVRKDFGVTKSLLRDILHLKNEFYYPSNYYYGMSQFFLDELDDAVLSFQKLSSSSAYKDRIPYYITQIYFKQERYDELIDYGVSSIAIEGTKNVKDIRGLLGQTYFLQKDFENAIYHLAHYVDNTEKLRVEDFYQLGFAYYQTGQYENAIQQFVEIANEKSKLGQNANNYLAESYLKTDDRNAARSSFKRTSELAYIPDLSEEALFNYGKLSADMGLDREALNSLKKIEPTSIYFSEAQTILSYVLDNTKDYSEALKFIENLEMQSPLIRETYQKVAYFNGMQFLVDNDVTSAESNFKKAMKNPINNYISSLVNFRMANIENVKRNYKSSIQYMNQYFSLIQTGLSLPNDASEANANYIQAYNYLKENNFTTARKYFELASNGFEGIAGDKKLRMDALLRGGDCYFRINDYRDAIKLYNEAVLLKQKGADYALYQRGILQGLLGKPYEKLVSMDKLIEDYPKSSLADFALYQNGETLLALGEASEAERTFRTIVDEYVKSTLKNRSRLKLGLIAYNQGNTSTAISYYKELFNHNPNAKESQEAFIALEEIYVENLGQPDEFFTFIEGQAGFEMSSFEKDSISFRSGDIPFENGEYAKAIESYSRYLERYPEGFNRIIAHYRRGESYSLEKKYLKALADYEYVIRQNINEYYLPSLEKAALINYNYAENFKKAFDYYSLLEELTADKDKQYKSQIGALRSAVRIDDRPAMEYMANKILLNPLITPDDKLLSLFHLGKINYQKKEYDQAFIQLSEVITKTDNALAAEGRHLIGQLHFNKNELAKSEKIAREAIVKSKPYPFWVAKSLMLLSDILVKGDNLLQAKAALEAILENFVDNESITKEAESRLSIIQAIESEKNRIETDTSGDLKLESGQNEKEK